MIGISIVFLLVFLLLAFVGSVVLSKNRSGIVKATLILVGLASVFFFLVMPFLWYSRQTVRYENQATVAVRETDAEATRVMAEFHANQIREEGVDSSFTRNSGAIKIQRVEIPNTLEMESGSASSATAAVGPESVQAPIAPVLVANAPTSTESSRAGVFIGRDSKVWAAEIEETHIADVYSSELEAIRSLSRQFAALYASRAEKWPAETADEAADEAAVAAARATSSSAKLRSEKLFIMSSHGFNSDQSAFFKQEVRRLLPRVRLLSHSDHDSIELSVQKMGHPISTFRLNVKWRSDEEPYVLSAKCVEKQWVRNEIEFREGGLAPSRYLVVWGASDEAGANCSEQAAAELEPRIAHILEVTNGRNGYHQLTISEVPRIAKVVVDSLTMDQFVQRFERNVDGTKLETPISREAVLLATAENDLLRAVKAAVKGEPFGVAPYISKSSISVPAHTQVRTRNNTFDLDVLFGFSVVVLGCFGMLKGFSWFFDR